MSRTIASKRQLAIEQFLKRFTLSGRWWHVAKQSFLTLSIFSAIFCLYKPPFIGGSQSHISSFKRFSLQARSHGYNWNTADLTLNRNQSINQSTYHHWSFWVRYISSIIDLRLADQLVVLVVFQLSELSNHIIEILLNVTLYNPTVIYKTIYGSLSSINIFKDRQF